MQPISIWKRKKQEKEKEACCLGHDGGEEATRKVRKNLGKGVSSRAKINMERRLGFLCGKNVQEAALWGRTGQSCR